MDINNTYTGLEIPKLMPKRYGRATMYYVPYNVTKDNGTYSWKYVSLTPENYNYGGLVDAIIGTKYDLSSVIAIVINYVGNMDDAKYKAEFDELQQWRAYAKTEAKKYFDVD